MGRDFVAGWRTPLRCPDHARLDKIKSADQSEHLIMTADMGLCGGLVVGLSGVVYSRSASRGRVRKDDVTAGRKWLEQRGDDGGRIVGVGDEVQDRDEQQS